MDKKSEGTGYKAYMNEETLGVEQVPLPPQGDHTGNGMQRIPQVGGQYGLGISHVSLQTGQNNFSRMSSPMEISPSPSRSQASPLRHSAGQSISNVLKSRPSSNVRTQLFSTDVSPNHQHSLHHRGIKRSSSTPDKDTFASKLQHVTNHRIVRSKIVKEKYSEHLLELFYLESGGNILDLYQYAKRPKSTTCLTYINEHAIDTDEYVDGDPVPPPVQQMFHPTPSATDMSSLPGNTRIKPPRSPTPPRSSELPPTPDLHNYSQPPKIKTTPNQEYIVEKAKQEAYVVQRITNLQKEGLWSDRRLPRVQEMPRSKAHWDYLLEEMVWLAADFAQERKWKKAAAKKCARMVQKYFQDKNAAAQKAEKAHEQNLKRIAAFCAKEVKSFWTNVKKLVEYKQYTILEEKRKKALDQQLSFIVNQTEKYSQLLAEGMNKPAEAPSSNVSSRSMSVKHSDDEFEPDMQSDDDEETIAKEEADVSQVDQTAEVEALKRESQLELDDLLEDDFLRDYLLNRENIKLNEDGSEDDRESKSETVASGKVARSDSASDESESEESNSDSESDNTEGTNTETKNYDLEELINDITKDGTDANKDPRDNIINDAAAIAESIQPKGNTLSSTKVSTKVPFLLKFPLREYQHIGLDWLVTMFDRKLNGILADEMGLGKTIQTIALLAHLACEKGIWGPHLIVVPTSVILNWEMELKKWCPAFKILTYYGSQKERKLKRTGWTKPNTFHVCITSYKLVIQDHQSFRRKRWQYLILDEAQNIKNFKSQRWQLLLNFQTERRLLLTGTPLQNNLMELWSLMHFLMPNVFQSHREFKEWFSNPVTGMIEGNSEYNESIIKRLHKVLRPFLLRRLKCEVEKQLPKKYEHVIMCRLSKRQRFLYDDYMSRAKTKETLETGNLLSVINILMQLRKVCNHPNLFEVRPTISPFQCNRIKLHFPSLAYELCQYDPFKHVNLYAMNFLFIMLEIHWGAYQCFRTSQSAQKQDLFSGSAPEDPTCPPCKLSMQAKFKTQTNEEKSLDKKDSTKSKNATQQNVKMKVSGVQILSQGLIKTIPLVTNNSNHGQVTAALNVLKPSDKIATSFAQLVQTSTGKHLLLTSNPNVTGSSAITSTAGGQKFTFLSKKPITAMAGNSQAITKAFVKFQLTSVLPQTAVNSTVESDAKSEEKEKLQFINKVNERKCSALPLYGRDFQNVIKIFKPNKVNTWSGGYIHCSNAVFEKHIEEQTRVLREAIYTPEQRIEELKSLSDRYILYVPAVKASEPELRIWHPPPSQYWAGQRENALIRQLFSKPATPLHSIASAMVTQFPDPRLIQYDCGKLQTLDKLLRNLKTDGHRVLIFTQMTKMLDVLEAFLNFHGHIYLRLDGSTKVEQRQVLMERFNNDKRMFVFILSTRSGGVGINLTGADTVIFYDSDWNPTMDAQAQDRCHRIGQTRDVHIYRLISERTIEENILKKANQKRQLGDLAIEGGNFTTAYFQSSSIQDLFSIDNSKETASQRLASYVESKQIEETPTSSKDVNILPSAPAQPGLSALESALAACEDDQDAQAAQSAKAEAAADLAEFDENIPLDQELPEKEPELSKAEQEINMIVEKLSPIERFAMNFIESNESALSAEQLAAAEREIEQQKQEWEQNHMAKMKEEEERRLKEMEEQPMEMLNYSREDASNQVWIADGSEEVMPMWCPPTPPHQETDVFLDNTVSFLYENKVMSESQLPPIYIKKELKRTRFEAGFGLDARRHLKLVRTEETTNAPRSLFYSPTISKLKKDIRMQKYRGLLHRPINAMNVQGKPNQKPVIEQPLFHDWTIHEDMALLKVLHTFQGLRLNLILVAPGQTPNWDFVADYVNTVSVTYRSAKQCKQRYENHLFQREEGRYTNSMENIMKKKKKIISPPMQQKFPFQKFSKPAKTSQLYTQDNNSTFTQVMMERFESIKHISSKRVTTSRTVVNNPLMNKSKNVLMLSECGIDVEHPILPVEVAARRAERLAKEKKTEQLTKLQLMKGILSSQQQHQQQQTQQAQLQQQQMQGASSSIVSQLTSSSLSAVAASPNTQQPSTSIVPQQQQQIPNVVISQSVVVSVSDTPPTSNIRQSRVIASPLQTPTVVSVTGLSPVQLQGTTQRIVVSPTVSGVQAKTVLATGQKQPFTQQQLQLIRQATMKQQPLRLHASALPPGSKLQTTAGGSPTVVQFSQGQPRSQFVRQSTVTVGNKTGVTRTVTESEVAQLLKKQHQLQQQKLAAAAIGAAGGSSQITTGTAGNVIHGVPSQVFAQALQQAGSSNTSVATLVRASSSGSGVTQTLTIPMAGSSVSSVIAKGVTQGLKVTAAQAQQLRHAQLQQQLLAQKKVAAGSKLSLTQIGSKSLQTQLIVGSKPLPTTMTVQQFQQVLRAPLNSAQGPVIVAKSPSRGIPVSLHGAKQTIQGAPVRIQTTALPSTLSPAITDTSQSDQSSHPQLTFIEKREKPSSQP